MNRLDRWIQFIIIAALCALYVYLEKQANEKEQYYQHIDSVLIKTDSMLIQAQKQIDSTNAAIAEIGEYL